MTRTPRNSGEEPLDGDSAGPLDPSPPPARWPEIFGWAMFDFANSSYTTVVITVSYSAFFTSTIVQSGSPYSIWSTAVLLGTLCALVLCPLAGAICDYSGGKKRFLALSACVCAAATACLYFVRPGDVLLGVALIAISNAAFMLGEVFCASFLTDLSTRRTISRISGMGWALGYFGGLVSLILVAMIVTAPTTDAAYVGQNRIAMVVTGAFFILAAIPTFVLLRNRSRPAPGCEGASWGRLFRLGIGEFGNTFMLVRRYRQLFRFLLAFLVYMAGLGAVINFVGIYTDRELGMTLGDRTVMFIVVQLSAAAGAFGFGFLEAKLGPKPTVQLTLWWWVLGVLTIYFIGPLAQLVGAEPKTLFFGVALVVGSAMGSTQSSSRAMVGLLTPATRSSQMFGFWGAFLRLSTLLAMTYGYFADVVGLRTALLLVAAFFVGGSALLTRVDVDGGIRAAHEDRAKPDQ